MLMISVYLTLFSFSLIQACDVFVGMTCTCYEAIDVRCTMSKLAPLAFVSSLTKRQFQSIDIKFNTEQTIQLNSDYFIRLNELLPNATEHSLSITLRFQDFHSFYARTGTFRGLFQGITTPYTRLTIELHPLKAKSIIFETNTFDYLQVNELSIYADSFTSPFESIFNNTNLTHLNIEGAIVTHDSSLVSKFTGQIRSLKVTRMVDTVNSDEFPSFPVQSYVIEAHKMRALNARSFLNYTQLTGLNIIQPDVSITPRVLNGLEYLSNLQSMSFDAERIADGALKSVPQIQTLILGSYLKILDSASLNSLQSLRQLDLRYVQFSTLQANTSCALADYINRRRMLGLIVYLPNENPDCDCVLVFLNNMMDNGEQLLKCQSITNDRCSFSSCPIVSEYFTRKQKEYPPIQMNIPPTVLTPAVVPSLVDMNIDQDSPFYPDSKEERTTIRIIMEPNIYDDEEEEEEELVTNTTSLKPTTVTTPSLTNPEESENAFSTPLMELLHSKPKTYEGTNYLFLSWIPFAIIASCLFLTLLLAMIGYVIYHQRHTVSFKLVPQTASII